MNRLDLLIYAHDGRGLGHASRSVAIGLAVRRLFPDLRVLFVSGLKQSASLIGDGRLDWVKLPAYETRVVNGVSRGWAGNSNFSDRELGAIRSDLLKDIVVRLKPRCVLCDHMPQGKHRELIPSLEAGGSGNHTHWVLGMRGVIGDVAGVWSDAAVSIFHRFYKDILWYGDKNVLGAEGPDKIARHFGTRPFATGYVSRLMEWQAMTAPNRTYQPSLAASVSIPWLGEHTPGFIDALAGVVERIGSAAGEWHIFLAPPKHGGDVHGAVGRLRRLPHCRLFKPGAGYFSSLMRSRMAIIYGGYNSLTDLLYAGVPGLVILRDMADQEQQEHLHCLQYRFPNQLSSMHEKQCSQDNLAENVKKMMDRPSEKPPGINLDGAEKAAEFIGRIVENSRDRLA